MLEILGFIVLGLTVGTFGTMIGAGGGFILTPILLQLYPSLPPSIITAISMTTVFFNSTSGSIAYSRMKRIDYKTGFIFLLVSIPGSILGTIFTYYIPKPIFNIIFGLFMFLFAFIIIIKSKAGDKSAPYHKAGTFRVRRNLRDYTNNDINFSFNMLSGVLISILVGFISGMLGIGGGIIHVPALVFLGYPAHFATATSQFVLSISSLTSLVVHISSGCLNSVIKMAACIGVGAVLGAQIGAQLSKRIKGSVIMISLALALLIVGARILTLGLNAL